MSSVTTMPTSIRVPDWSGQTNIAKPVSSSERPPASEFSTACRMSSSEMPCLRALARISTSTRIVVNNGSRERRSRGTDDRSTVRSVEPFGSSSGTRTGVRKVLVSGRRRSGAPSARWSGSWPIGRTAICQRVARSRRHPRPGRVVVRAAFGGGSINGEKRDRTRRYR